MASLLAGCTLPVRANTGDPPVGPPVISETAARQALAGYIAAANNAGRQRSTSLLATCEAGSAEQIDAAWMAGDRVAHPAGSSFQPWTYTSPAFYIPRQWSYPRWFVVQARSRQLTGPDASPENGYTYLVFEKPNAVSPWLVVLKPDSVAEGKPLPRLQSGGAGTGSLSVPAAELPSDEAAYLNRTAGQPFGPDKISGELQSMAPADRQRLATAHPAVSDVFRPGAGPPFALATAGGGALVLYSVTDTLDDRASPPYRLDIHQPLFSGTGLSELRFAHVTQLAAYDPPRGKGKPDVLASFFGVTSITGH
jgi:hypothetical protein